MSAPTPNYIWRPEALAVMQKAARKWHTFATFTFYGLLLYTAGGIISLLLWAHSGFTSRLWLAALPCGAALPVLGFICYKSKERARLWHLAHFYARHFNTNPKHRLWAAEQAHAALCRLAPRSEQKRLETL